MGTGIWKVDACSLQRARVHLTPIKFTEPTWHQAHSILAALDYLTLARTPQGNYHHYPILKPKKLRHRKVEQLAKVTQLVSGRAGS